MVKTKVFDESDLPGLTTLDSELTTAIATHNSDVDAHGINTQIATVNSLIAALNSQLTTLQTQLNTKLSAVPAIVPGNTNFTGTLTASGGFTAPAGMYSAGRIVLNVDTYGSQNNAVGLAVVTDASTPALVGGSMDNPSWLAYTTERAKVTAYFQGATVKATINAASATYTATSFSPNVAVPIALLKYGMIVDTKHPGGIYSGYITGWNIEGTIVYVSAWFGRNNPNPGQIPPDGIGCLIDPQDKAWVKNVNGFVAADSEGRDLAVFEIGGASYTDGTKSRGTDLGLVDCVTLGSSQHNMIYHFRSRDAVDYNYQAFGGNQAGYYIGNSPVTNPAHGFLSHQNTGNFAGWIKEGTNQIMLITETTMELGSKTIPGVYALDFHTGQNAADYCARFIAYGGVSGVNGSAIIQAACSNFQVNGGSFEHSTNSWERPFKLLNLSLWQNGSQLRIKNGTPTSATDGTLLITAS